MGHGVRDDSPNRLPKVRQSEKVAADLSEFLARGGQITQVEQGVTGERFGPPAEASRGGKAKARNQMRQQSYAQMLARRRLAHRLALAKT